MRICLYILLLVIIACFVSSQRNNRNNNRNNRFQNNRQQGLRNNRQQGLRNNRQQGNRGRRPNRNQNVNRRPKAGSEGKCAGGHKPNHSYGGQNFLVSWRVGCSKFTQSQGEAFCRANGMRPISLDSADKEDEFLGLIAQDRQRYFWTGGKVNRGNIRWPSGKRYNDVNWSHTGGAKRPQPDNREGDEECLAVLNNFYKDGIRFHDVSCHHKKPIICES